MAERPHEQKNRVQQLDSIMSYFTGACYGFGLNRLTFHLLTYPDI